MKKQTAVEWLIEKVNSDCLNSTFIQKEFIDQALAMEREQKETMKATLEFNLPDDEEEFRHAVRGEAYFTALHRIYAEVRYIWKYRDLPQDQQDLVDEIYEIINKHMNESHAND